jgi:hypothetical protein
VGLQVLAVVADLRERAAEPQSRGPQSHLCSHALRRPRDREDRSRTTLVAHDRRRSGLHPDPPPIGVQHAGHARSHAPTLASPSGAGEHLGGVVRVHEIGQGAIDQLLRLVTEQQAHSRRHVDAVL